MVEIMGLKRLFTKRVNIVLVLLLAFIPISYFVQIIMQMLYTVIPKTVLADYDFVFSFAVPQFLYPVLVLIFALICIPRVLNIKTDNMVSVKKKFPVSDTILTVCIFLGASVFLNYITNYLSLVINSLLGFSAVPDYTELFASPSNWYETILNFIVVALLPAVCEEIVYRGLIIGSLKPLNKRWAIIVSALAFGFMHGTAQQIPAAVIMGLFLGYLYVKFESIIMVITIHFINNSITCIFNAIELYCNDNIYEMVNVITAVAVIFAGIMSVILYIIKHSRDKKSQVGPLNNSEAMSAALSAPSLWCYLIIYTMITVINTISMNMI